jgi:hypothetical protein
LNHGNYAEFGCTFSQLEADQVRAALALYSGARTGEYNVKEIKNPILGYNIYLLEAGCEGMATVRAVSRTVSCRIRVARGLITLGFSRDRPIKRNHGNSF